MTDKQIIGGRGSAKSYTTLNTIEVMLENKKLKEALKAKEQECERLKHDNGYEVGALERTIDNLKAEKEELKRYKSLFEKTRDLWNEASKTNYKLLDEIEDLKDSLKRTICQSECYKHKKAEKLSKTLTEIKEIAEEWESAESAYMVSLLILQKISEVEDEN